MRKCSSDFYVSVEFITIYLPLKLFKLSSLIDHVIEIYCLENISQLHLQKYDSAEIWGHVCQIL